MFHIEILCVSDTAMPKKRGRGRPKGSGVQNCQESVRGNLNSDNIPSNMVEVGPGCEESENAGMVTSNIWIVDQIFFLCFLSSFLILTTILIL